MDGLTSLQELTMAVLSRTSNGNEITGRRLAREVKLSSKGYKQGADMRSIINALRIKGKPICANSNGYFLARNKKELDEYIESLDGRIEQMERARDGLLFASPYKDIVDIIEI